jgi:hypothetical protein
MHPLSHWHPCVRALATLAITMLSVGATTAALAAAVALLGGCGGAEVEAQPSAANAPDSDAMTAELDVDALGSLDAVVQEAAAARGAPGEAEPVRYVVRARHLQHALHAAAELERRGFSPVHVAGAAAGDAADAQQR